MMCLCICIHHVYVYVNDMCLFFKCLFDCNYLMKGVISYFPSPGVVRYVVSMCIPSEQEFGGSVEIRRPNTDIPNETECKRPSAVYHACMIKVLRVL